MYIAIDVTSIDAVVREKKTQWPFVHGLGLGCNYLRTFVGEKVCLMFRATDGVFDSSEGILSISGARNSLHVCS